MDGDVLIKGLPTLMAIYPAKLERESVLAALRRVTYPAADVFVYHRLKGTDQVIDAATGQIAAGQAIAEEEISANMMEHLETLVLIHPQDEQLRAVHEALSSLGPAVFMHESDTQCIRR